MHEIIRNTHTSHTHIRTHTRTHWYPFMHNITFRRFGVRKLCSATMCRNYLNSFWLQMPNGLCGLWSKIFFVHDGAVANRFSSHAFILSVVGWQYLRHNERAHSLFGSSTSQFRMGNLSNATLKYFKYTERRREGDTTRANIYSRALSILALIHFCIRIHAPQYYHITFLVVALQTTRCRSSLPFALNKHKKNMRYEKHVIIKRIIMGWRLKKNLSLILHTRRANLLYYSFCENIPSEWWMVCRVATSAAGKYFCKTNACRRNMFARGNFYATTVCFGFSRMLLQCTGNARLKIAE